jgi:hypothetical protein
MTSRLRKMILINAKNSGKSCSGRITEIDPRGGAAITGANGVGKTTTLQLLPLFFGFSPNQIAPVGENRESMLRFVLAQPESSLAFEYQRGDEEDDICMVVLRRQPQTDAAEYRFFEGPFREEYFVSNDDGEQAKVFLDDAGSVAAATKLGCAPSSKHTSSQYRNVILGTIGVGKDADSRRNEARKFSFSKRRLPYLDRLVAAVVKEHINFVDFTDVAATIVTDRMGGIGGGFTGKTPQLRQSKEQIERWLRDRDGAERALKLKPVIEALRGVIGQNQQQEILLGHMHADVQHLRRINERIREYDTAELMRIEEKRKDAKFAFGNEHSRIQALIDGARGVERVAENAFRSLKNIKRHLEDNEAQEWASKAQELAGLQVAKAGKFDLINSLQDRANGIAQQYEYQIIQIKEQTSKTVAKIKDGKTQATAQYDSEVRILNDQESESVAAIDASFSEKEFEAQESVDRLREDLAAANQRRQNPSIAPEIEENLALSRKAWSDHQEEHINEQRKHSELAKALQEATQRFNALDQQITLQKQRVHATIEALNQARARARPAEGSLLAALNNCEDEAWRETLARVIDPSLLSRTDLHAHLVDDGSSIYGWAMNVGAIEAPTWIQKDLLEKEVESCK